MATDRTSIHGQWSSRWIFILAATGSAVGLGNIWRFPYITAEHGGGAFVLIYLVCIVLVGLPIMMSEIMLGRRGRRSPIHTMEVLAEEEGRNRHWRLVGVMGVFAGFFILTFYSVVAGWTLAYIVRAVSGMFTQAGAQQTQDIFAALVSDPERLLAWHTLFMIMTVFVISRGVKKGLEQAVRYLMPALFLLLLFLVAYSMTTAGFSQAVAYLFKPDFSQVGPSTILVALGQAFFSLSLGMGAIMTYGSYLSGRASIPGTSVSIVVMDTGVALLAGLAIFPIMFTFGLQPEEGGPGLIFKILPIAFGQMAYGRVLAVIFFTLLMFAAWTSALSILEPITAWLVEKTGFTRLKAAIWSGTFAWILGLGSLLSLNLWSGVKLFGMTFFSLMEYLSVNIMLPVGGLFISLFAAWFMARSSSFAELGLSRRAYLAWKVGAMFIAPAGVILILLQEFFGFLG
ncbi:MAG: sodium-dependent transporter [Gammaproteobacteria bacterium]|nr:sodium-dependent transporter [Gammaproteobacteria bacterium]